MHNFRAKPLKRVDIRSLSNALRNMIDMSNTPFFPIVHFAELVIPQLDKNYCFAVKDIREMGENHGLTEREGDIVTISIRSDIYDRAYAGEGRDRGTVAHEVGHYFLHARSTLLQKHSGKLLTYEDPEWQAKCFQGELLIPRHLVAGLSAEEVAKVCGVSVEAAAYQLRQYRKER